MHLRVITPHQRTNDVIALLSAHHGVVHLVVLPGSARDPEGDVVECDTAREATSAVLEGLRRLGVEQDGAIMVQAVEVSLSDAADRAEAAAPGLGEDAVVWEEIEQRTSEETRFSGVFVAFMIVAMVIASIGVLLDQPILIVGAMVVGPEFGPLASLCVGLVRRKPAMLRRSLIALAAGFAIAVPVTVVTTWALTALGLVSRAMLLADRPLTDFIWRPDALSWVVALAAGIAGMLSLTSAKSGALVGVLISVTTIPAAANAAVAVAYWVPAEAGGSLLQLLVNLTAIVVGGVGTLLVQRLLQMRRGIRPASVPER